MEKSVLKTKVFIVIAAKVLKSFGQLPIKNKEHAWDFLNYSTITLLKQKDLKKKYTN